MSNGKQNVLEDCTIELSTDAKPFNAAISLVAPERSLRWEQCTFGKAGVAVRCWFPDVDPQHGQGKNKAYPASARFSVKGREPSLSLEEWTSLGMEQPAN